MSIVNYNTATFLLSVVDLKQLPADTGAEVAFIGRSNAGKSSAINAITGINGLARTSKTPGRTQAINYFALSDDCRLVDLPGYGYTKAPLAVSQRWLETVNKYLQTRECLHGLCLIMDVRHPLKEHDQYLLEWAVACEIQVHILLTKVDKLNRGQASNTLLQVKNAVGIYGQSVSVQLFSSHDKTGLDEAHLQLNKWFAKNG